MGVGVGVYLLFFFILRRRRWGGGGREVSVSDGIVIGRFNLFPRFEFQRNVLSEGIYLFFSDLPLGEP